MGEKQRRLKVVNPPNIKPISLGSVFSSGFKIGVKNQVIILGEMVDHPRPHGKGLLFTVGHIPAIHLGGCHLFQVVSIDSQP